MSIPDYGLGGRLPLLEPKKLQGKQRELYKQIDANIVPWADKAGFKSKDDQGHLIGPFNLTLYSPEICESFLALQKAESEHTTLSRRARQVVILTVGSVWKAAYELYAHRAEAAEVGLTAQQIDALIAGRSAQGLSDDELIVQRFTHQIVQEHAVSGDVFAAAQTVFGDRGLVDALMLIGCYLSVCALLNAFMVPDPTNNQP